MNRDRPAPVIELRAMIFAIDLEGVLAPEIWPILGARFELQDLNLTTRDVRDFSELMHVRVKAIHERGLTLKDLQSISHAVEPYLGAQTVVWAQEETRNRGAWSYMLPILHEHLPGRDIVYAGRESSASPATGSLRVHRDQQATVVADALGGAK